MTGQRKRSGVLRSLLLIGNILWCHSQVFQGFEQLFLNFWVVFIQRRS